MPTYQYACTACGHKFDAVQSFSDDALTDCPQCSGRLRKVFSAVGIVFKGSGFYRTDSRSGNGSSVGAGSSGDNGSAAKSESNSGSDTGSSTSSTGSSASSTSSGSASSVPAA